MSLKDDIQNVVSQISSLPLSEQIEAFNLLQSELASAFILQEPISCIRWVDADRVIANDYNPNAVAPPEMKLLSLSIEQDGYTQPIVTYYDEDNDRYVVVDGFHRSRVGKEVPSIRDRVKGHLPIVVINKSLAERMSSTIRHNRARGTHGIAPMSKIVEELYFLGWSDKKIAEQLGMDKDEVLRLKQFTGLGTLFSSREFSMSWRPVKE